MDELKSEWDAATDGICTVEVSDKWWDLVRERFSSKSRVYHDHVYLKDLFKHYYNFKDSMKRPQVVALAIFFHKLEFDPRTGDGDEKSLEQLKKFLEEAGGDVKESEVGVNAVSLLEACGSNLTEAHMTEGGSGVEDRHYLLDMALAGLGAEADDYKTYADKIQAEYTHLDAAAYVQLRLKILQSLLLIPNVYATKAFQEQFEKQARANIAEEIQRLRKQ